jgi:hypothetical protein
MIEFSQASTTTQPTNFIEFNNITVHPVQNAQLPAVSSSNSLPDLNANYYQLHKVYVPPVKKNETIKDVYPLLKQFKPRYTKRENIDKKIIRKFKTFLKDSYKSKELASFNNGSSCDKNFWIMFINGNILPPIKYTDSNTGEVVDFKSFNAAFMNWLFSKRGAEGFYNAFVAKEGENTINFLTDEYLVHKIEDIKQLDFYVKNLYKIFTCTKTQAPKPKSNASSVKADLFDIQDENLKMRFRERSREFDMEECNGIRYYGYNSDKSDEE